MPLIMDIFNSKAFSAIELTEAINYAPNLYGRLAEMGLFSNRPVPVRTIPIQIDSRGVNLLPAKPWGGTPSYGGPTAKKLRSFILPHFPHNDAVFAEDVQGLLSAVGGITFETAQNLVNDKLAWAAQKHAITWEYLRWGALNGLVYDANGVLLLDIYGEFGIRLEDCFYMTAAGPKWFTVPPPSIDDPFGQGGALPAARLERGE